MSAAFDLTALSAPNVSLIDQIGEGLPLRAVDRLAEAVAPDDKGFRHHFVSRPTYARRKASAHPRLSQAESDRVVRFARVWDLAVRVWGDDAAARAFLSRPHPLLEGRTPLRVVLSGEQGGRVVEDVLGRLQHGAAV